MNNSFTSLSSYSPVVSPAIDTNEGDRLAMRQFQLEWYWQSAGGNPAVFPHLLPLFDVVEQSPDGTIVQEVFEARLEELKIVGIERHFSPSCSALS